MYVDLKPDILQALRSHAVLASLLGIDEKGKVKVYPEVAPDIEGPYVTFLELTNFHNQYGNNRALSSEIHFQIDVWSPGNTAAITIAANEVMEELNFIRTSSIDRYESGTQTYHKILRYKKIHYRS